jgi:hypothetical protein
MYNQLFSETDFYVILLQGSSVRVTDEVSITATLKQGVQWLRDFF